MKVEQRRDRSSALFQNRRRSTFSPIGSATHQAPQSDQCATVIITEWQSSSMTRLFHVLFFVAISFLFFSHDFIFVRM